MVHFSVSIMNTLNQTESAVFQLCRFAVFPKNPLFRLFNIPEKKKKKEKKEKKKKKKHIQNSLQNYK